MPNDLGLWLFLFESLGCRITYGDSKNTQRKTNKHSYPVARKSNLSTDYRQTSIKAKAR